MRDPILIVDDDPDALLLFEHAAKVRLEADLHMATDGEQAMGHLRAAVAGLGRMPALVVLDIELPGRSGLEVLRWLRGIDPLSDLTVVVWSSAGADAYAWAYKAGADGFYDKPARFSELVELVETIRDHWLTGSRPDAECRTTRRR